MRALRGNDIAMIFQDPLSSLHPFYRIGDQLVEAVLAHRDIPKARALDRAAEMLDLVGIPDARARLESFPHEFSGGMRQRVMIAMGLINDPKLLIADEPTTALDVTVQAQILDLLKRLQTELKTAIVLITHDLGVVAEVTDEIGVMYAGRIVEYADTDTIFEQPEHPYTWGLLRSIPHLDSPRGEPLIPIAGRPPSLINKPGGCAFHPRCPYVRDAHKTTDPTLMPATTGPGHTVACLLPGDERRALVGQAAGRCDTGRGTCRFGHRERRMSTPERETLFEVRNLVKHFPIRSGIVIQRQVGAVRAVDGISFDVKAGETLGIVGESGCGKSTTARLLLRLLDPTSGTIAFRGQNIADIGRAELKPLRREMQMIFQDPYSSLNPRKTVGSIIGEPFIIHKLERDETKLKKKVQDLMDLVGLNPEHYNRYPHEFSGGQRQRIGVARALAVNPSVIIADEPVSALDVSIQAQILNLLSDLRRDLGLTIVFIAHDLSVVRHVCDRVAVMYLGKIMEIADADDLFSRPRHPYTRALLSAVPVADPKRARARTRQVLLGDVPSPTNPPSGCRFHTRCPRAHELAQALPAEADGTRLEVPASCVGQIPELQPVGATHETACWYPLEGDAGVVGQAASKASSLPARSNAERSSQPPMGSPSMMICGTVMRPVISAMR